MLGEEKCKIQLCNDAGVEQYVHTLEWIDLDGLVQIEFNEIYDTDNPIILESGDKKFPIKGYRVGYIAVKFKYESGISEAGWETFLERLCDWTQKIKVTPNTDSASDTYWVRKLNSWNYSRGVQYLQFKGVLEFEGVEILTGVV